MLLSSSPYLRVLAAFPSSHQTQSTAEAHGNVINNMMLLTLTKAIARGISIPIALHSAAVFYSKPQMPASRPCITKGITEVRSQ